MQLDLWDCMPCAQHVMSADHQPSAITRGKKETDAHWAARSKDHQERVRRWIAADTVFNLWQRSAKVGYRYLFGPTANVPRVTEMTWIH